MSPFVAGWKGGDTNHRSETKVPAARFLSKMGTKLLCTFCTNVPLYFRKRPPLFRLLFFHKEVPGHSQLPAARMQKSNDGWVLQSPFAAERAAIGVGRGQPLKRLVIRNHVMRNE